MKLTKLLSMAIVAGSIGGLIGLSGLVETSFASTHKVRSQIIISQNSNFTELSGIFVAAEAPTTGMARIVEENGQRYLEIDSAFSTTDQAPDLHVLLDTVSRPPQQYTQADSDRYLNLGSLRSVTGSQRYPIPEFVDVSRFDSVVIWCRMANATIGYASLTRGK